MSKNFTKTYAAGQQPHAEQPAQQCKWPTCQSEEAQQALAEQIKRELVGEQPAQQEPPTIEELEQEIYENTRQFVSQAVMQWMLKRYYTAPQPAKPAQQEPVADEQSRELFAAFVKKNLGDIAVMDGGRYISHKINNYWLVWQAAHGITKGGEA